MMNLHKRIAGKVTRSEQSWKQNEKMIENDKGFLIKVTYKEKLVSYSFFFTIILHAITPQVLRIEDIINL